MIDTHPAVPLMKLLEQVRIDLEQVEGRRIRQRGRFHETQQEKEIVQLGGLLAEHLLVAPERDTLHDVGEVTAVLRELFVPVHRPTMTRKRKAVPPRSSSLNSFEI